MNRSMVFALPLVPRWDHALANIIMTELEKIIITPLVNNGTIKFYRRYVDDTLLLVKPENIKSIHDQLNSFDPDLRFTVDCFEEDPHFLELWITENNEVKIYRKQTNTGLYVNFDSYVPWDFRKSWITSLVTRAKRICSPPMSHAEFLTINK